VWLYAATPMSAPMATVASAMLRTFLFIIQPPGEPKAHVRLADGRSQPLRPLQKIRVFRKKHRGYGPVTLLSERWLAVAHRRRFPQGIQGKLALDPAWARLRRLGCACERGEHRMIGRDVLLGC